jgi:two-component system sensor histidine kinase KdpD
LSSLLDDADLLSAAAQKDLLRNAWEQSLRLNRLVGNLLDMARLESGAMKVKRQLYDVQELVGTAVAQMPNRLQGRTVELAIPDDLPAVSVDLTLMAQALINLIDNAVKYAPTEQPIEVEAYVEQQMVMLAVKDRGPGLPEGELEHIFDKFYRLDHAGVGGTGLGLSIAQGIIEAHEGRIWARNREGGGAVFTVALPAGK